MLINIHCIANKNNSVFIPCIEPSTGVSQDVVGTLLGFD